MGSEAVDGEFKKNMQTVVGKKRKKQKKLKSYEWVGEKRAHSSFTEGEDARSRNNQQKAKERIYWTKIKSDSFEGAKHKQQRLFAERISGLKRI